MADLQALWDSTEEFLQREFGTDRSLIFYNKNWDGELVGARRRQLWKGLDPALLRYVYQNRKPELRTPHGQGYTAMCVPLEHGERLMGLIYAHRLGGDASFNQDQLDALQRHAISIVPELVRLAPPPDVLTAAPTKHPSLVAGRYQVENRRKSGRVVLYQVKDLESGQPMHLRRLAAAPMTAEERSAALEEGRRLAALDHRNLPRVLRLVECHTGLYLALEEFRGETLAEGGAQPLEIVERYLEQFLDVLDYLHGHSIAHGALRPDSVLVTRHGVLKLVDVGRPDPEQASPRYASPERRLGEDHDVGSDLYALGAILEFLATGTEPARSVDRFFGSLTPPELGPLGAGFTDLVRWMTEPDPVRRAGSVAEVRERLTSVQRSVAPARSVRSVWDWLRGRKAASLPVRAAPEVEEGFEAPAVDLAQLDLAPATARILSETLSQSIQGVCIGQPTPDEVVVAVKDPTQVHIYDNIEVATQGRYRAQLMKADPLQVDLALEFCFRYHGDQLWHEWLERKKYETDALIVLNPIAQLQLDEVTSPIVEAVDRLLKEAISAGASDVHLECFPDESWLRYRIDGVLRDIASFPSREASAMVKRIKIMANMDIAQEHITQGGRISLRVAGQELDLRVSLIPVPGGEGVVLRLLRKGGFNLGLADLGFASDTQEQFERILAQPFGMVLSCGPTGSGKSTTLYASLKVVQRPDRKLLTVEDPIEYHMPRVQQVQVLTSPTEEHKRVTFARALREFLRQDPDVILVGEIRDTETAQIAVQAALTGHVLLSTLHTNDSVGVVARLRDMGIESFLIGSTLLAGVAQRLARRICPDCKVAEEPSAELSVLLAREGYPVDKVYRGTGCKQCHGTGYRGRTGLFEVLEVTPEIRALINGNAREEELRRQAQLQGFRDLFHDGLRKIAAGELTFEEVSRVTRAI